MEKYPWWTNEVVIADYLDQNYTQSFGSFADFPKWLPLKQRHLKGYRNTAKMLTNENVQLCDYVWANLAFFNFFQRPVATRPGNHDWLMADFESYIMQAHLAFDEVMKKLNPDIVIVWGKNDLYKNWMPLDKEQKYPHIKFFAINHPSYNIKAEIKKDWDEFVMLNGIDKSFAAHYPYYKEVESIFLTIPKDNTTKMFSKWYGERSIGFKLSLDKNENAIILMFTYNEDGSSSLTIQTRAEEEKATLKIFECVAFQKFAQKKSLHCDGIFELQHFDRLAKREFLLSTMHQALQSIVEYHNQLG